MYFFPVFTCYSSSPHSTFIGYGHSSIQCLYQQQDHFGGCVGLSTSCVRWSRKTRYLLISFIRANTTPFNRKSQFPTILFPRGIEDSLDLLLSHVSRWWYLKGRSSQSKSLNSCILNIFFLACQVSRPLLSTAHWSGSFLHVPTCEIFHQNGQTT